MTSTLAQGVYQIGIVAPDIHKGMTFFKDKLGVPEFLFIEKPELQDETYLGKPAPLRLHLAFGWCGDTQVELIQPISGVSTYSKFLDHNPKGGMHHYGIEVSNYAQGVKEMESQGYALVQGGRHRRNALRVFRHNGRHRHIDRNRLSAAGRTSVHAFAQTQEVTRFPDCFPASCELCEVSETFSVISAGRSDTSTSASARVSRGNPQCNPSASRSPAGAG